VTEWRSLKMADVMEEFYDGPHATPPPADDGPVYLGIKNITEAGLLDLSDVRHIAEGDFGRWTKRATPLPGDIVFTYEATLHRYALIPDGFRGCLGRRLALIRPDRTVVHPRFLHLAMLGPDWRATVTERIIFGATVDRIPILNFPDFPISIPPLDFQKRVAEVLGSIDDLIENNRRRVEVLEEMARAIYREWFVHFRYPGHGDVPLVDSPVGPIPEGWACRRLDEVAKLVRGRSYRKSELVDDGGLPFVNLKCMMRGGGFRRDGLKRYDGKFSDAQLVGHGDLVLAVTDLTQGREILARATLVPRLSEPQGVISLDVARIVPLVAPERLWIFAALRWSDFADRVKEYANGSTVLHLSPDHVAAGLMLCPPDDLRAAFVVAVAPMLGTVDELADSSDQLTAIRDLLLPKLVTGQIDVSHLDLNALTEAATA